MKIFSSTHTIVAAASAAVLDPSLAKRVQADHYHAPGTLLELSDEEGQRLVHDRFAVRYDRAEHGEDPRTLVHRQIGGKAVQYAGDSRAPA